MSRLSLPVVTDRSEFGFARSACACPACAAHCRYQPGALVPADLDRLAPVERGEAAVLAWARQHLLASPGAVLGKVTPLGIIRFRVPSLVPARQADGLTCHWLTASGQCAVHTWAPYSCAFFDDHMSWSASEARIRSGLAATAIDFASQGRYARVWQALVAEGLVAPAPEVNRARQAAAARQ